MVYQLPSITHERRDAECTIIQHRRADIITEDHGAADCTRPEIIAHSVVPDVLCDDLVLNCDMLLLRVCYGRHGALCRVHDSPYEVGSPLGVVQKLVYISHL